MPRKVIVIKYGIQRGGSCSKEARGHYEVSLWRNISNGWGSFSNFVSYKVGNGSHIRFRHDMWCREGVLKYSFTKFYSIAHNKEALVSTYLDLSSSPILWNPGFNRAAHDWELKSLDSFISIYYTPQILI